jgi:ribosome-associated heat shock protein Hsp15
MQNNILDNNKQEPIRLDKWLWAARFFKTRSLCKTAISKGKIHINNDRPKTSRKVNIGDEITIQQAHATKTIIVIQLSEHRGPATQAEKLYKETEQSIQKAEKERQTQKDLKILNTQGYMKKPTKKTDRRALSNIKKHL